MPLSAFLLRKLVSRNALKALLHLMGLGLIVLSLLGIVLFFTADQAFGLGSTWRYRVWQPNGLNYEESQVVEGLELCGLRLCYVRASHSEFLTSRLWLSGWKLVKSEVTDVGGNSRVTEFDDGIVLYELPMKVGNEWVLEDGAKRITKAKAPHGGWVTTEDRILVTGNGRRVTGLERLVVPAGTFIAYVVDHYEQNGVITQRLWFNESVGDAVKYIYGLGSVYYTRWELESFELRPKSFSDLSYLNILHLPLPIWTILGLALLVGPRVVDSIPVAREPSHRVRESSGEKEAEKVDV